MRPDRPPTSEELNFGEPSTPRPAATVLVLRGEAQRLEVLLVQRNPAARFMGGIWVFPGGVVDPGEGSGEDGQRQAAMREVWEETGLRLAGPEDLALVSHWITPAQLKMRFDTAFFLAEAPPDPEVRIDGQECVDFGWFEPANALQRYEADSLPMVLPTLMHLQELRDLPSAEAAVVWARERHVQPVEPRVIQRDGLAHVVLPGDPEWE